MKTPKHTPGPWSAAKTGNHQGLVIDEPTGNNIAVVYNGKANTDLIAAAPELLEALQRLETWLVAPKLDRMTLVEMQGIASEAIARATGE